MRRPTEVEHVNKVANAGSHRQRIADLRLHYNRPPYLMNFRHPHYGELGLAGAQPATDRSEGTVTVRRVYPQRKHRGVGHGPQALTGGVQVIPPSVLLNIPMDSVPT
jgi:hypothetical protein